MRINLRRVTTGRILLGVFVMTLMVERGLAAESDLSRRLFDFAPVSAENPIVATLDDSLQIPLSELRAYCAAEHQPLVETETTLEQKRVALERLIDQYLLVDEAYRSGVPSRVEFLRQMEATRTMMLNDFLSTELYRRTEYESSPAQDPLQHLGEKLFDEATIAISNEAYAVLKQVACALNAPARDTDGPALLLAPENAAAERIKALLRNVPPVELAHYENHSLPLRQVVITYAAMAVPRPQLEGPPALLKLIKPFIIPELLASEATRRGIPDTSAFQQRLIQNQNTLLRFHAQGEVEQQANTRLRSPEIETDLRAWYGAHRKEYSDAGTFEAAHDRVMADYSVELRDRLLGAKIQSLRRSRKIVMEDSVLEGVRL